MEDLQWLTISSFIKAVSRIAVAREDDDAIATVLQTYGGIDDKSLRAANTQVWMEEDYGPLRFGWRHWSLVRVKLALTCRVCKKLDTPYCSSNHLRQQSP